uniref:Transposase InsH N-terminal domain-containing protein n=1 Tax=uncultured Desulfobacterium sp. TaxID=201089 RepID=E1YEG8_9BACT|nr:hypothetical protein N47_B20730 [uncultured Desulfobacterium sp.]
MNPFEKFTINSISKKLNNININISVSHRKPFPNLNLLSAYQFKNQFVKTYSNGDIKGGYCRMITSLIDFSFIRSMVAHCYSDKGPPCYDPPSPFLLDLFRYIDGHQNMKKFLEILRDKDRGRAYRTYAGISEDNIPCEGTFSIFRERLGEALYNEIFHLLVRIFHQLEMITFNILAHDGTLYPTWARYKGCTYFCNQCSCIRVEDVIGRVKSRILYRLDNLDQNNLGSEVRVHTECPSDKFPEKDKNGNETKKPKIELLTSMTVP